MRVLCYVLTIMLAGNSVGWAQDSEEPKLGSSKEPIISVLGKGEVRVAPDYAEFTLTITSKTKQLKATIKLHEEKTAKTEAFFGDVKKDGLEIESSNFRLNENYEKPPEIFNERTGKTYRDPKFKAPPPDYIATTNYRVRTSQLENLNKIVSALMTHEAFDESTTIRYYITNERDKLNDARKVAAHDAKEQAKAYVEAVDHQLKEVIAITDGEARHYEADMPTRRMPPGIQIVIPPKYLKFSASVQITWRIAPK